MKYILLGFINIYQSIPGPWHNTCRHIPTCSEYTKQAIIRYGSIKGTYLGIKRILRLHIFVKEMYAKRFKVKCHGIYNLLSNGTAKKKKAGGRHEKC